MADDVRVVTCDDHAGPHVFREPDTQDDENCSNAVDLPDFEHACTDNWSIGWYLCLCGEPWLNQAQRCLTQPGGLAPRTTGSNTPAETRTKGDRDTSN